MFPMSAHVHAANVDSALTLQGQQEGLGSSFLKSLHTRFRFPAKADKTASADLSDKTATTSKLDLSSAS